MPPIIIISYVQVLIYDVVYCNSEDTFQLLTVGYYGSMTKLDHSGTGKQCGEGHFVQFGKRGCSFKLHN